MVFEGGFCFLENTVIFDPIDRIWILGGFQPSVHSETASSAIFYLWVWKMTFFIFENPGILSTPGWLYICYMVAPPLIHVFWPLQPTQAGFPQHLHTRGKAPLNVLQSSIFDLRLSFKFETFLNFFKPQP